MAYKDYTTVDWESVVYYDETSPSCLRWKIDIYSKLKKNISAGDPAGNKRVRGEYRLEYDYSKYYCHRIIWLLFNRDSFDKTKVIDHVDGDPSNNKISNLRLVTHLVNGQNQRMAKNNTSGVTGVCNTRGVYWTALWRDHYLDKMHTKSFNILKLGNDTAFKLAVEYRKKMIDELNSSGQNYTERHGV